jgi:autotransporter strand-loop-strand O-heptosyltransferase
MLNTIDNKMKILFLAPHLSTGGMPAFLLKRIEAMSKFPNIETFVVEYADVSPDYVVQKNKIKELVPNFFTLGEDKMELISIIRNNNIDVVHIDEMAESLGAQYNLLSALYSNDRTWRIVETCHNVAFNPDDSKRYHPDAYAFCTPYHEDVFSKMPSLKKTIEFPIDPKPITDEEVYDARIDLKIDLFKKHVVNVGLWTSGKNQGEGLEIARRFPDMHFHFVGNQAPNFAHYWRPLMQNVPPNVTIWGERNDVDVFMKAADIFMFNSVWECNPLVLREAISYGLPIVARNLPQYKDMFTPYLQPMHTYLTNVKAEYTIPTDNTSDVFGENHYSLYKDVLALPIIRQVALGINITQHFVNQPFLEITGESISLFDVKFYDENNKLYHQDSIRANHWVKLSRQYYTKWRTEIWENGHLIYNNTLNLEDKRVYISLESASLGDTIAWIPYCLEFKNKEKCNVIVSTFKNFLFKDAYPELEFVEPGAVVANIYAQYRIGWFYNNDREPALPNTIPLQQTATNILGLDYQEIKPRIAFTPGNNSYSKFVTIATNSTAGCKFWLREEWQKVINFLVDKGYTVLNVSKERNEFDNCLQLEDTSMQYTMDVIHHSEFFIGLSSGLSWLAWALNKKVVMISNFTDDNHEFECIRITNKSVCHGCWNKPEYKFDKGDWNWCPVHKGTDRQFECHTSITAEQVIDQIKHLIPGKS